MSVRKIIISGLLFLLGAVMGGQEALGQNEKPVLGPRMPRTALVGPNCVLTSIIQTVGVAEGTANINHLLDTDLSNSMTIAGVAGVDLLASPIVQVKDRKNYYAAKTKAGFCIEGSGGSGGLLSLDLLSATYIFFYKDGKKVGEGAVETGQDVGVLGLDILQIPGSQDAMTYLMAEAPAEFDEIGLMIMGVGDIDVLKTFKIRYAFVGDAQEIVLHKDLEGVTSMEADFGFFGFSLPLVVFGDKKNFIDDYKNTYATATTIAQISIGKGGIKAGIKWEGKKIKAGTEVGFMFEDAGLLGLNVGSGASIIVEGEEILLDMSVVKLGLAGNSTVKVSVVAPRDFSHVELRINLGVIGAEVGEIRKFFYAYTCEPTQVPDICDLGLSMDANICETQTQYQLTAKEPVIWSLIDKPEADYSVQVDSETGAVTNMTPNVKGTYQFRATSKEDPKCFQDMILTRGIEPSETPCNKPVTKEEGYEVFIPGGMSGGILPGDKLKDPDNVVDNDMDTYAEYIDGLDLLTVQSVVGVQNKNGVISDGTSAKRIGFLVEMPWTALNLDLLGAFEIRAYDGNSDNSVYKAFIDRSNIVSVGLIGTEKAAKVRFSIEVPKGNKFDRFALWNASVLSLHISTLRIYGAFVEETAWDCDDPLGCEAIVAGGDELPFTTLNYDGTYISGINVGSGLVNLEKLIDDDLESYATLALPIGVLNHTSVAIRFERIMNHTHQVGLVLDKNTLLGNVGLLKFMKLETYLKGELVDSKMDWNVLGADVIGYGDKSYLMMNPKGDYDEVRLKIEGVLDLNLIAPEMNIYGAFIRRDSDGDGIPDCSDPESCGSKLTNVMTTRHICTGDKITVTGMVSGLEENEILKICFTYSGPEPLHHEVEISKEGPQEWILGPFQMAERYMLYVDQVMEDGSHNRVAEYPFDVHPNKATWKKNPISTNWNEWNNWEEGSPWTCTNVIIPTGANRYPILTDKEMNGCNLIHFEPNTEVVRTHYLTYTKAWVEMALSPNCYYMLAAPLKGMYSGDMFISKGKYPEYFTDLTETSYEENRTYPTIYQRLWETTALDRPLNGNNPLPVYPEKTRWTKPYNHLATLFGLQNDNSFLSAFSLWVDPEGPDTKAGDEDTYLFRFPKLHETYNYVNEKGETIEGKEESISRIPDNIGRFIYENLGNEGNPFPLKVRLKNNDFNNKTYLMGNPFMAHISIAEFLKINTHISSVKVYDGNINYSVVADIDDGLVSNTTGLDVIAPMQSVFIVQKDNAGVSQYCEVTFTEEMLVPKPDGKLKSNVEEKVSDRIVLIADVEGKSSTALVRLSDFASDEVVEGEDSEILLENEVSPAVALFVENEGKALDIEQRANLDKINLGFCMSHPAAVNLQVSLPVSVGDKVLEDLVNNRIYLLKAGETTSLILPEMDSQVGRFRIVDESMVKQKESVISIQYLRKSGLLEVRSFSNLLERCDVYTIDGRLVSQKSGLAECYQLDVPNGMLVVRAITENGDEKVMKLRVAN